METLINTDTEWQTALKVETSAGIIAPPGGRKTTLVTEKAQRELQTGARILCLVFTRHDAEILRERLSVVITDNHDGSMTLPPYVDISTIHAFCHRHVGWRGSYDGMLLRFVKQKFPDEKYDWVFVDEFQDLNAAEFAVVDMVSDKVFAVGDPYQSIFGFQGAMGEDAFKHLERAKHAQILEMHGNFRSCPKVVDQIEKIFKRDLVSKHVVDTGLTHVFLKYNDNLICTSLDLKKAGIAHTLRITKSIDPRKDIQVLGSNNIILSTVWTAKGRECDRGITYCWHPYDYDKGTEAERVSYVALSRSSKENTEVNSLHDLTDLLKEVQHG